MLKHACTCLLLLIRFSLMGQSFSISGYVTDDVGEPAIGATIFEMGTARKSITNQYGYFVLRTNIPNTCLLVNYLGFKQDTCCVSGGKDTTLAIPLSPLSLQTVEITDQKTHQQTQMSIFELPMQLLKKIPSLGGEQDIIKGLAFTPGITNGTEGSAGLFVRGGTPDQNLILLDNAVVYNPNHIFGFLSVFNPDAVKKVTLLKGGFPARYGGRLSSVLDITMKEGNRKRVSGEAGIGLISSRVLLEGPLGKKKAGSFMVSARSAYLDLLLLPTRLSYRSGRASDYTGYNMYDINAKMNYDLSRRNKLFVSFYTGRDRLQVWSKLYPGDNKTALQWGNLTGTIRHNCELSPRLFLKNMLVVSDFGNSFSTTARQQEGSTDNAINNRFRSTSGLRQYSLKQDIDFYQGEKHTFRAGLELTRFAFRPKSAQYSNISNGDTVNISVQTTKGAGEAALYLEDEWSPTPRLTIQYGIRWNRFGVDSAHYNSWQPRLAMKYDLSKQVSLKSSFGAVNQNLHLLASNNIGLQNDIWVPSTAGIRPQKGYQAAIGFSAFSKALNTEFSLEVYGKKLFHQIDYKEGVNVFGNINPDWEQDIATNGKGKSYGVEFGAVKQVGAFTGMFAATWSRSFRQFDGINGGTPFRFKYDLPLNINTTAAYEFNKKWDVSATFVYHTGQPFSMPVTAFAAPPGSSNEGVSIFYYKQRNNVRLPDYVRVDLGANYKFTTRHGRAATLNLSVFNALNRKNPLYAQVENQPVFNYQTNQYTYKPTVKVKSFLPIIPSVSYSFKF